MVAPQPIKISKLWDGHTAGLKSLFWLQCCTTKHPPQLKCNLLCTKRIIGSSTLLHQFSVILFIKPALCCLDYFALTRGMGLTFSWEPYYILWHYVCHTHPGKCFFPVLSLPEDLDGLPSWSGIGWSETDNFVTLGGLKQITLLHWVVWNSKQYSNAHV